MRVECNKCGKTYSKKSNLTRHEEKCSKNHIQPQHIISSTVIYQSIKSQNEALQNVPLQSVEYNNNTETKFTQPEIEINDSSKIRNKLLLKVPNKEINKEKSFEKYENKNMNKGIIKDILIGPNKSHNNFVTMDNKLDETIENIKIENENVDENEKDELFMMLFKQFQEINQHLQATNKHNQEINQKLVKLEEKMELIENNQITSQTLNVTNNTLQVTYNVYLNNTTDLYKIFDDYGISDENKCAKLIEMCKDSNKLAFLVRDPLKDWIKKNDLIYMNNKKVYIRKDINGFAEINLNDLNLLTDYCAENLYKGLLKNYLGPKMIDALERGDDRALWAEQQEKKVAKEKKIREDRIKMELRRKRDEEIIKGNKNAKYMNIDEEYKRIMAGSEHIFQDKLKFIEEEVAKNPILDTYIDLHGKNGTGLIDFIQGRKKKNMKIIDRNMLMEYYRETEQFTANQNKY